MGIHYDEAIKIFHLQTPNTSYVIQLVHDVVPVHRLLGPENPARCPGAAASQGGAECADAFSG